MSMHRLSKEERLKKLAELKRQEKEKQKSIDAAEKLLDLAKKFANQKKFITAREKYLEAANFFYKIKWIDQAKLLEKEAENMKKKMEELKKITHRLKEQEKQKSQVYEQRAAKIIAKKEEKRKLQEQQKHKLTPEIQRKYEEAEFVLAKAERKEKQGKFKGAIQRYKFLIELYDELQFPNEKIVKIQEKIKDLQFNLEQT
ncbi:MAG: hypothetical protein K9W44_16410 [Candidatus Lokiarchaeota archaeon]|nr:hypothetical protein [Candidatus Harpocratesius repetitus]